MRVYIKFIIYSFLKSFLYVSIIVFGLVLILNLLTEIEFFKNIEVGYYFPVYVSLLNSPSLVFEMFPFIFLVSTQVLFINLLKNDQITIFKYSGLKNSNIRNILIFSSFFTGILLITLFYNLSSNLKNFYLELKNNYTADDKYLAVITNNGLWIKDNTGKNINIINASKIDDRFLINASITQLDTNFEVLKHIQSEKIDISSKNWLIFNPIIYRGNDKSTDYEINFYSNFDYQRIQSLFSNLSSLSMIELFELKKNYSQLNLSTTGKSANKQANFISNTPLFNDNFSYNNYV